MPPCQTHPIPFPYNHSRSRSHSPHPINSFYSHHTLSHFSCLLFSLLLFLFLFYFITFFTPSRVSPRDIFPFCSPLVSGVNSTHQAIDHLPAPHELALEHSVRSIITVPSSRSCCVFGLRLSFLLPTTYPRRKRQSSGDSPLRNFSS